MKPLNKHHLVKLIDNTEVNPFYTAHVPGYTNLSRIIHPNMAKVVKSDIFHTWTTICFYSAGIFRIPGSNYHLVDDGQVFFAGGQLTKPGVIVKQKAFAQQDFLSIRTQDFFQVRQTNCSVQERQIIIAVPNTSIRFNLMDETDLFFVADNHIMLVIDPKGVTAGPDFEMLEIQKEKLDFLNYEREINGQGEKDGKTHLFFKPFFRIRLKGVDYWVVRKGMVYGRN